MCIQDKLLIRITPGPLGSDRNWWIPGRRGHATRPLIRPCGRQSILMRLIRRSRVVWPLGGLRVHLLGLGSFEPRGDLVGCPNAAEF